MSSMELYYDISNQTQFTYGGWGTNESTDYDTLFSGGDINFEGYTVDLSDSDSEPSYSPSKFVKCDYTKYFKSSKPSTSSKFVKCDYTKYFKSSKPSTSSKFVKCDYTKYFNQKGSIAIIEIKNYLDNIKHIKNI